jgi:ProP effector
MNDQITTPENSPYAWLTEHYPAAFPRERPDIRPLKIGIREDIQAAHPELDPGEARRMLACWCGRPSYQRAVRRGGPRIDLAGEAAGEVSPEQMAHAEEVLKAIRLKKAAAAAQKPAEARSAPTPAPATPAPLPAPRVPLRPVLSLKRGAVQGEQESGR